MELRELKLTARRYGLLQKMKIDTVEQLLKTYPFRYETIEAVPFDQWEKGDNVALEGLIASRPSLIRLGKNRTMTRFPLSRGTRKSKSRSSTGRGSGSFALVKRSRCLASTRETARSVASNYNLKPLSAQTGLRPVYSLTKGMKPADMQAAIKAALKHVRDLPDLIPSRYRQKYRLLDNATAYEWIHEPRSMRELHQAIRTLKYEEFLCFQCCVQAQQVQTITKEAKVFDQSGSRKKSRSSSSR